MRSRVGFALAFAVAFAAGKARAEDDLVLDLGGATLETRLVTHGTFVQGSPTTEVGHEKDEEPAHQVTLTKDFWIGKYPVTRGQFAKFIADTRYVTEAEKDKAGGAGWDGRALTQKKDAYWRSPGFTQTDEHPVVLVTFGDANAFAGWASRKSGKRVRLPTEAEWEYAARAGSTTPWYGATTEGEVAALGWFKPNAGNGTRPVGQKKPNVLGVFDISGNVFEWCRDIYAPYREGAAVDPESTTNTSAEPERRVLRGGSWFRDPKRGRSADRYRGLPNSRNADNGFRVVVTNEETVGPSVGGASPDFAPASPLGAPSSNPSGGDAGVGATGPVGAGDPARAEQEKSEPISWTLLLVSPLAAASAVVAWMLLRRKRPSRVRVAARPVPLQGPTGTPLAPRVAARPAPPVLVRTATLIGVAPAQIEEIREPIESFEAIEPIEPIEPIETIEPVQQSGETVPMTMPGTPGIAPTPPRPPTVIVAPDSSARDVAPAPPSLRPSGPPAPPSSRSWIPPAPLSSRPSGPPPLPSSRPASQAASPPSSSRPILGPPPPSSDILGESIADRISNISGEGAVASKPPTDEVAPATEAPPTEVSKPSESPAEKRMESDPPKSRSTVGEWPAMDLSNPPKEEAPKEEPAKDEQDEPAKEEPPTDEAPKDEPAKDEPAKEEAPKDEPAKDEPAKEEPAKEDPAKEEPAKEEPAKEEPAKDEPAKEEPAKEEPAKEEPPKDEASDNEPPKDEASEHQPPKDEVSKDEAVKLDMPEKP